MMSGVPYIFHKPRFPHLVWAAMLIPLGLASAGRAVETNTYHTNRVFTPVTFTITSSPTAFEVCEMVDQLTSVVGGTNVVTNSYYATEYQCMVMGHGSAEQAWAALAGGWSSNSIVHTNQFYDNSGWIKGVQTNYGTWGGYIWFLENTVHFKTSPTNVWVSTNGVTNIISRVLVGSVGDFAPMTDQSDSGPGIAEGLTNFPTSGGPSNEVRYKADFTAYYDLGELPLIYVLPFVTNVCVNAGNVNFTLGADTRVTNGVTWSIIPAGVTNGATLTGYPSNAVVNVGGVATTYIVRATANENTNIYGPAVLNVIAVDILETNIFIAVSNTASLHLTSNSSVNVQWEIIPTVQTGATIQGSAVGASIVVNAGSLTTNYTVRASSVNLTNFYDTCTVTVIKLLVSQLGFDCTDGDKKVPLKKTGAGSYTNTTYSEDGNTSIFDPVWTDANLDAIPDLNPPDPVCFLPGAVSKIAGTVSKLKIQPNLGGSTLDCKLRVLATPQGNAGIVENVTFGPVDLTLSSAQIDLPEMVASSNVTVGSVVNNFNYAMHWQLSTDGGATWPYEFEVITQRVFVAYSAPMTNYCSGDLDSFSLPYTWSGLACTAKRMDWATTNGMGCTGDELISKVAGAINAEPGFDINTNFSNPFTQLDTPDPSQQKICCPADCISLANLAATALRLLGTNARPCKAFCNNSVDTNNSATWGWNARFIHPVHTNEWFLGYPGNNYEGFFYIGDENPLASSNFPSKGWTVGPSNNCVTTDSTNKQYLPIYILQAPGVMPGGSQLQWQSTNNLEGNLPDVQWTSNNISGVLVDQDPVGKHCTNWFVGADGPYPIGWDAVSSNLTLDNGTTVNVSSYDYYTLPCSNGSISAYTSLIALPTNSQTGTVSIVPARSLAPLP